MPYQPTSHHESQEPADQQQIAELIACLVVRTGLNKTAITTDERQAFYERFPRGFGLVVLAQQDGSIAITVESTESRQELEALVERLDRQGSTINRAEVPARFFPEAGDAR